MKTLNKLVLGDTSYIAVKDGTCKDCDIAMDHPALRVGCSQKISSCFGVNREDGLNVHWKRKRKGSKVAEPPIDRAKLLNLRNEVDCRVQHGADSGGLLEYVLKELDKLLGRRYED